MRSFRPQQALSHRVLNDLLHGRLRNQLDAHIPFGHCVHSRKNQVAFPWKKYFQLLVVLLHRYALQQHGKQDFAIGRNHLHIALLRFLNPAGNIAVYPQLVHGFPHSL